MEPANLPLLVFILGALVVGGAIGWFLASLPLGDLRARLAEAERAGQEREAEFRRAIAELGEARIALESGKRARVFPCHPFERLGAASFLKPDVGILFGAGDAVLGNGNAGSGHGQGNGQPRYEFQVRLSLLGGIRWGADAIDAGKGGRRMRATQGRARAYVRRTKARTVRLWNFSTASGR